MYYSVNNSGFYIFLLAIDKYFKKMSLVYDEILTAFSPLVQLMPLTLPMY